MPLPKRMVEPVLVSRNTIPDGLTLPSELEAATNGTLANIIRQLSSLSRHAEDLFGELEREAHNLQDRSNSLQARIDKLAIKVTQLDSNVEEGKCEFFDLNIVLFFCLFITLPVLLYPQFHCKTFICARHSRVPLYLISKLYQETQCQQLC